jgi:hypothetical protein
MVNFKSEPFVVAADATTGHKILKSADYIWIEAVTTGIPYYIDDSIAKSKFAYLIAEIHKAIEEFHKHTVIKFLEISFSKRKTFKSCLQIGHDSVNKTHATVGKQPIGNDNQVYVGTWAKSDVIIHELLHVLGFNHEHSRADRDWYIKTIKKNAMEVRNFVVVGYPYGPYDIDSIMHYPFNDELLPEIITVAPEKIEQTGKVPSFSKWDVLGLEHAYGKIKDNETMQKDAELAIYWKSMLSLSEIKNPLDCITDIKLFGEMTDSRELSGYTLVDIPEGVTVKQIGYKRKVKAKPLTIIFSFAENTSVAGQMIQLYQENDQESDLCLGFSTEVKYGKPIFDLKVFTTNKAIPEIPQGYELVDEDLNQQNGEFKIFLCYKRTK